MPAPRPISRKGANPADGMTGDDRKAVGKAAEMRPTERGAQSKPGEIDRFLASARQLEPLATGQAGRLVFALDATMSRQPSWDLACSLQGRMFEAAAKTGGLAVQLVYFRGFDECRASGWLGEPQRLTGLMNKIDCRGGQTQIARVLKHIRDEERRMAVRAFVYVGDAMEEDLDRLCGLAGELGLRGVRGFVFQEGWDPAASAAFAEIARLTGGAHARFDVNAPDSLLELLRGAAAYASGGREALVKLAGQSSAAKGLLTAMEGRKP